MEFRTIKCFVVWAILFFSALQVYAQYTDYMFKHFTIDDGLSQTSVTAIAQDSKGFMWLGTYDGLNRFDGQQFTAYKNDPYDSTSLSHNFINTLYCDRNGTLWVGTKYGLNRYDRFKNHFYTYLPVEGDSTSLSDAYVNVITEDAQGNIWVGTNNGLNLYNKDTDSFDQFYSVENTIFGVLENDQVTELFVDSEGNLWIGTFGGGVQVFRKGRFMSINTLGNNGENQGLFVKSITEDAQNRIWVATHHSGLLIIDKSSGLTQQWVHEPENPKSLSGNMLTDVVNMGGTEIWVASTSGLNIWHSEQQKFRHLFFDSRESYSLLDDQLYKIFTDREGAVWIGSSKGLSYYNRSLHYFTHYYHKPDNENSLSDNLVFSIFDDPVAGGVWLGTLNGLNFLDRKQNKYVHYIHDEQRKNSLAHNQVWSVIRDHKNRLWIGTNGGLDRMDAETGTFEHVLQKDTLRNLFSAIRIRHIFEDSRGELWISTAGSGLYRIDSARLLIKQYWHNEYDPYSLPGNYTKLTYEDHTGTLWVGTSNGLGRFDREKENFKTYRNDRYEPYSLSNDVVFSIAEDKNNQLWVGTAGGGLNYFDQANESFLHIREKDGLPNDVIYSIAPDDKGNLWVSTNKGLTRFTPHEGEFRNFDTHDGLQSNEFINGSFEINEAGEIFFGGVKGFNIFHPDSLDFNKAPAPAVVTDFLLFNKALKADEKGILQQHISETREIHLSYKQSFFTFEFVAVNFDGPDKMQYAYKLEGFDGEWNYVGSRQIASYTGVPPGEYVFKVKSGTKDGQWNDQGQTIRVVISPPFWKAWWFRILFVLVLAGSVYSWNAVRIRRVKWQKDLLKKQVQERTAEVMLQKEEIRMQYEMLENIYEELQDKNKSLNTSIAYARKIQEASLPPVSRLKELLPDSFILFGPRETVSGDFFWFTRKNNKTIVACADCTGHGVPGAFMSMTGSTILSHIVNDLEILEPGKILTKLHREIRRNLRQEQTKNHDGMDIALCVIDHENAMLSYAGAKNPLVYIQEGEMKVIKGNRYSIGGAVFKAQREFTTHHVALDQDSEFYLFTDGYADQFGGKEGRKFMTRRLKKYLFSIHNKSMDKQQEALSKTFASWLGTEYQQIDDVLVMGFRLKAEIFEQVERE